ncbi:MAG: hypothetical protein ACI4S2_11620 [Lachnospiraceae bacterium]
MEKRLQLGGVDFLFCSERELEVNPELELFSVSNIFAVDVTVFITWNWDECRLPHTEMIGQDALLSYYKQDGKNYCITRGGFKGPVACAFYTDDFKEIHCVLNEKPFLQPTKKLGSILRMLPMREVFLHFQVLFLHAAQISWKGKGILFSAPAGIGKSTQAKLWRQYRGAEIVCNDRTLIRKIQKEWKTYGYPLDGSEPVRSSKVNSLGCVVLLERGTECSVKRLHPGKAISRLMSQVVMDSWSGVARIQNMELIGKLIEDVPVYVLCCTPEKEAVDVLEIMLIEEKVIMSG